MRIAGEPDSPQNRLRAELYGEAFERINRGIKDKRYFEVIALADSIITDRVQALTQDIIRDEPEQYAWMSVGGAVASLLKEVKTRSITLPPELRRLLIQALSFWSEKRNIASHGFVVITPKNLEQGLESRLENLKDAAVEGGYLARNITDEIDKFRSQKI